MIHSPTHEKIAHRAQEIWHRRGCPEGTDTAIWLEAEHQLTVDTPEPRSSAPAESHATHGALGRAPAAGHLYGGDTPVTNPAGIAAQAAFQKNAARAPQAMHRKNAVPLAPPESGKPVWDKPHSS